MQMKKCTLLLYGLLVLMPAIMNGQDKLRLIPEKPARNQEVLIRYDTRAAGAGIPDTATRVELVFTYSNFYEVAGRIPLQKNGPFWETRIKLPRYATYATFILQQGNHREQAAEGRHFTIPVYEKGERVFSGYLYEGYSLPAQMGKKPELAGKQALLYEQELKVHPNNYEAKLRRLVYLISKAAPDQKEELRKEARKIIAAKFYEQPGNMGLMNKTTMGYLIIGENSRLDSLRTIVRARYPNTEAGYELRIDSIAGEADSLDQLSGYLALVKEENPANKAWLRDAHRKLFEWYATHADEPNALKQLELMGTDESPYRGENLKAAAALLYKQQLASEKALQLTEEAFSIADQFPAGLIRYFPETGYIPSYVSPENKQLTELTARGNLKALQALLLLRLEKKEKAAAAAREALRYSRDPETLVNAGAYYSLVSAHREAYTIYKEIVYQVSDDSFSFRRMHESFLASGGTQAQWLNEESAWNNFWTTKMQQRLEKEILDYPAPEFLSNIVDLTGRPLPAHFLKNKTVILDFWATWCVPCINEMPYLQRVYDKYKQDSNVVFMVINSGSNNSLQDARQWWGNKKFSFPIYYNTDRGIGEKLGFNLIPATYIIDRNGQVRFKTLGFEGAIIERKFDVAIQMLKNVSAP